MKEVNIVVFGENSLLSIGAECVWSKWDQTCRERLGLEPGTFLRLTVQPRWKHKWIINQVLRKGEQTWVPLGNKWFNKVWPFPRDMALEDRQRVTKVTSRTVPLDNEWRWSGCQIRVKNSDVATLSVRVREACCFQNRNTGGYSWVHACSNDTENSWVLESVSPSGQRLR